MKVKLPFIPTAFTALALILLLALGSWQVQRLLWKQQLIRTITERLTLPPIPLSDSPLDIELSQYRKVTVTGHFLHDKEIHLFTGAREIRGEPGYNILTPLKRDNGQVVLVDRGWVPTTMKQQDKRPKTLIEGPITITGMLHQGEKQGLFTPENDPVKNLWFWIDIPAVAGFTGKLLNNVYVRALTEQEQENILPIAGKAVVEIRNDHLEYAMTWYSFAIILLVIYILYIRGLGYKKSGK